MNCPQDNSKLLLPILDELFDGLFSYAMVLSRDRSDAEDLVQETCVRAIQAAGSLRPEGNNIKSWLFTILRNIWLNQLRKRRTAPPLVELDVDERSSEIAVEKSRDPHGILMSKLEHQQVRDAILQLPEEFREIVLLREYEELSYEEIAAVLGCPQGTVMSRLARARDKLRSLLSGTLRNADRKEKGAAQ